MATIANQLYVACSSIQDIKFSQGKSKYAKFLKLSVFTHVVLEFPEIIVL